MSEENVEVVRVAYEVFAREGLDRFMEHLTDDIEYRVLAGGGSLELGALHGKDAVRAWFQDWIDMFEGFSPGRQSPPKTRARTAAAAAQHHPN